jgi:hypothetical protein
MLAKTFSGETADAAATEATNARLDGVTVVTV